MNDMNNVNSPVYYNESYKQRASDLATAGMTNTNIAKLFGITLGKLVAWIRDKEGFKDALYAGRANMIEGRQVELAQVRELTETTKKYKHIIGEDGVAQRMLVDEEYKVKQIAPDSKALDRLAGKYCQDLAPKERKEVDHNVVFMIDTGVPQATKQYIEGELASGVAIDSGVDTASVDVVDNTAIDVDNLVGDSAGLPTLPTPEATHTILTAHEQQIADANAATLAAVASESYIHSYKDDVDNSEDLSELL